MPLRMMPQTRQKVKERVMLDEVKNAPELDVDVSHMNYPALAALKERIEEKVREMREVGAPALREEFVEAAAALGMTIEEIVQTGAKRRGRPRKDQEED
jgi:hypothetical protein